MIRLLIAADSPVVRAGLEALAVSSGAIELLGAFPDLSPVEDLRPDVVLAAMTPDHLPALDGEGPAYVLLAGEGRTRWTQEALRSGVRAILSREASAAEILAAVDAAAAGLAAIGTGVREGLLPASGAAAVSGGVASGENPVLTPRELEVLAMMAEGAANKTIAWKLNISEHTAKFHVASVLNKLNAATRAEAVAIGIRRGLVML